MLCDTNCVVVTLYVHIYIYTYIQHFMSIQKNILGREHGSMKEYLQVGMIILVKKSDIMLSDKRFIFHSLFAQCPSVDFTSFYCLQSTWKSI